MKKILFLFPFIIVVAFLLGCSSTAISELFKKSLEDDIYKSCMDKGGKIVISEKDGQTEISCESAAAGNKADEKDGEAEAPIATSTEEAGEVSEEKPADEKLSGNPYVLTASATAEGVKLIWDFKGVDTSQGYKIVKSTKENPVYPGDDYQYLSSSETKNYLWKINDGVAYYFRVCQYLGGKCGVYTNNVKVTTLKKETAAETPAANADYATSITLGADVDGTTVNFNWSIAGGSAPKGYKLVVSPNPNPVYPGNEYKYFSDPTAKNYSWQNLKGNTLYNFRICVYKGGECGAYSQNIVVTTGAAQAPDAPLATAINLLGSSLDGKVNLSWSLTGGGSPLGYKVVMSENANPVYPGNLYHYISSESVMADSWGADEVEAGKTYHFRACVYLGGECGTYSNDVGVTVGN